MKLKRSYLGVLLALVVSLPAHAHISYTGRDFGTFTGMANASATISNQAVTGNFGWADATDADFGDSHKSRAFRFHLDNEAWVNLTVDANPTATLTSVGGLLPGFSIYSGLAHVAPATADHDGAPISVSYLASLPGAPKEGAWNTVGDWKIGSDAGVSFADLSSFTFKGYAVDGNAANFGSTPGIVGDAVLDGHVTGSFKLAAGDYSVFIGGADYNAQSPLNPNLSSAYGLTAAINVSPAPEPETYAMLMAGLSMIGFRSRFRRKK